MSLLTYTEKFEGTYLLILRADCFGTLYGNQERFFVRGATFDMGQYLRHSNSEGVVGKPLRSPAHEGSRLELPDVSPVFPDSLNFFLCLAERLLLGLAGLLGALRLGRLARFERGRSSRE